MPRQDLVGDIRRPSVSGSVDEDRPYFIYCVDGRHPKIHDVWDFREAGITPEVHPTAHVDVGAFVGEFFATNYLTQTWRRVPMFVRKSMNVSVKWLGVPNFLRNSGPPWTLNLLSPYADWG